MDMKTLLKKVNEMKAKGEMDLSSDEDLSIAIMNLISIEEHLYFTGIKTNKKAYFGLINSVREMRKGLLKRIVKEPEGEVWCISKHLLAASMRLIEVGNKQLGRGEEREAFYLFRNAFDLYSIFWSLNLKMISKEELKKLPEREGMRGRLAAIIKKLIDCCKE